MFGSTSPLSASALRLGLPRLAGPLGLAPDDAVDGAVDDAEAIEQIAALEELKNGIRGWRWRSTPRSVPGSERVAFRLISSARVSPHRSHWRDGSRRTPGRAIWDVRRRW
jgi:hypothetical protein